MEEKDIGSTEKIVERLGIEKSDVGNTFGTKFQSFLSDNGLSSNMMIVYSKK